MAVQATGVLLAFYAVCLLTLLSLLLWTCLLIAVMLGAMRFGVGGLLKAPLARINHLISLLAQSLSIRRGPEYTMPLRREQATGLFDQIETAARLAGVRMPGRILLEMSGNAWVRLRGYRAGRGHCTLGIGYDLLVLLTEAELAAVLTHEMAHARLVQRGYTGWLKNGLARLIQFAHALEGLAASDASVRLLGTSLLGKTVNSLRRSGVRAVAALSRQNEFAADRLAAGFSGSETYARTLMTITLSGQKRRHVTWRDRLVQWQRSGTLTDWLRQTLLPVDDAERARLEALVLDPARRSEWGTHPALADRLATLASVGQLPQVGFTASPAPALGLLTNPDEVASALIVELEGLADREEKRESERLRRVVRKERGARLHTPGESIGMTAIAIGAVGILFALFWMVVAATDIGPSRSGEWVTVRDTLGLSIAVIGLGASLRHLWRHRDRLLLSAPAFSVWEESLGARDLTQDGVASLDRRKHELTAVLQAQKPLSLRGRKAEARYWADLAYDALKDCDYARAGAAADLCLEANPKCLEGKVALGIVAAYIGDTVTFNRTLEKAIQDWGVGPSLSWALGWGMAMLGHWKSAEAYLHDALSRRDGADTATLWALLSICQWQQEKLREATDSARRAAAIQPPDVARRVLLTRVLVAAGRPADAAQELAAVEAAGRLRGERALLTAVQVHLQRGQDSEAARFAATLEREVAGAKALLLLAKAYDDFDRHDAVRDYLSRVCALGFYPVARMGLSRLAYRQGDYAAARIHLLAALDMTRLPAPDAEPPTAYLENALLGLASLNGEAVVCEEWIADVTLDDGSASSGRTLRTSHLVLRLVAPSLCKAKQYAAELYGALRPGRQLEDAPVEWKPGPPRPTDAEPISPGVYDCRFS